MTGNPVRSLLRVLLAGTLPPDWRDDILRDLEEMHTRRPRDDPFRAELWYLRQAVGFAVRFALERASEAVTARTTTMTMTRGSLRQAARRLLRDPGFSVPVLLLLSLGVGASATIFAVIDGVLLEPLPLPEPDELVVLCERHPSVEGYCVGSVPNTEDLGRMAGSLTAAGTARSWGFSYEDGGDVESVSGGIADPDFFVALGVDPALGRLFAPGEIGSGRDGVAVLSHAFWTRRYGADDAVLGRTVRLDGDPVEIVGVLPPGLEVPTLEWIEVWRPLHVDPAQEGVRGWRGFTALGRLSPDAGLESAAVELAALYRSLGLRHQAIGDDWRLDVRPLLDEIVGETRRPLWTFLAGVGVLLLIAAANVASLVVARSVARRRETAVRVALGARTTTLVGHLVVEGVLVGAAATLLGLLLARTALPVLVAVAPAGLPRFDNVALDMSVLLFGVALGGFTVVVFALAATFRAARPPGRLLTSSRPAGAELGAVGPHRWLVTGELAMSVVLVFGSLLLGRSFAGFLRWDPGIDLEEVLVVSTIASTGRHETRVEVMDFWREAEDELARVPGVATVGTGSAVPLRGGLERSQIRVPGLEDVPREELPSARWYDVGPTYFDALGIPVLRGRTFLESDDEAAPPVALVNRTFAERFWPDRDPLGQWIEDAEGLSQAASRRLRVVGVVEDVPPVTPGQPVRPEFYFSNRQFGRWGAMFVVRAASGSAGPLAEPVRRRLEALDPTLRISAPTTMAELFEGPLARPRFHLLLGAVFAASAMILAGLGLYGVLSYAVARRRRAIGLRMAVGCTPAGIVARVLREGVALLSLGLVAGLLLSLGAARLLEGLVFGVGSTDPVSLVGSVVVLGGLAMLASAVPAVRAGRLDPARLLREE